MSLSIHVVVLIHALWAFAPGVASGGSEPTWPRAAKSSVERTGTASRQGAGLIAAGALVGGLGLAANVVRIGLARKLCRSLSYDSTTRTLSGADVCLADTQALLFLSPSALVLNVAGFGLVAAGGHVHGRWAAQWSPDPDRLPRRGRGRIVVGVAVMSAGLLGYGITRAASYVDMLGFNTCSERHGLDVDRADPANSPLVRCLRGRYDGYLVGITLAQTASIVGVGLLAQGASFSRNSRAFALAARHRLRLQPVLSRSWSGLALSGEF